MNAQIAERQPSGPLKHFDEHWQLFVAERREFRGKEGLRLGLVNERWPISAVLEHVAGGGPERMVRHDGLGEGDGVGNHSVRLTLSVVSDVGSLRCLIGWLVLP